MKKFTQIVLTIAMLLFSNVTIKAQKRLICWQMDQAKGTPAYLIDHWPYIETLSFDGVVIFPANYRYQAVMQPGQTITYDEIITTWRLGELSAKFNNVKHNYLIGLMPLKMALMLAKPTTVLRGIHFAQMKPSYLPFRELVMSLLEPMDSSTTCIIKQAP